MISLIKDIWPLLAIEGLLICTLLYTTEWDEVTKNVKSWLRRKLKLK